MRIYVDGKEAVLKAGSSFEYVSENPLFTDAEGYSLEIEFPLKDQPENILIFGALHVQGVDIKKVTFPCVLDAGTFRKTGILTIVSVSEVEVKGQFLEGMSQQNYNPIADLQTYLTDLDFHAYDGTGADGYGDFDGFPFGYYDYHWDSEWGYGYYTKNSQKSGPAAGWDQVPIYDTKTEQVYQHAFTQYGYSSGICRHIYLKHLVEIVAQVIGWTVDQSILTAVPFYQYILVANRRKFIYSYPYDWVLRPLNASLPKWTVKEFFQNIADYFGCVVIYDSIAKSIKFSSYSQVMPSTQQQIKQLTVNDDFEMEVSDEEESKYKGSINFKLPDDSNPDNINICPWILTDGRSPVYNCTKTWLLNQLAKGATETWKDHPDLSNIGVDGRYIFYLTDLQRYAIVSATKKYWIDGEPEDPYDSENPPDYVFQTLEIINQVSGPTEGTELKVCNCVFKSVQYYDSDPVYSGDAATRRWRYIPAIEIPDDPLDRTDFNEWAPDYPQAFEFLSGGERDPKNFYFDKLWLLLMVGDDYFTREYEPHTIPGQMYEHYMDDGYDRIRVITDDQGNPIEYPYTSAIKHYSYTLSPNVATIQNYRDIPKVDESKLYRFKFLGTTIPSPTSVFLINGQKYACLRFKARFTVDGMSELIEGEFYEIVG